LFYGRPAECPIICPQKKNQILVESYGFENEITVNPTMPVQMIYDIRLLNHVVSGGVKILRYICFSLLIVLLGISILYRGIFIFIFLSMLLWFFYLIWADARDFYCEKHVRNWVIRETASEIILPYSEPETIKDWCLQNCMGRWKITYYVRSCTSPFDPPMTQPKMYSILFARKEDAAIFLIYKDAVVDPDKIVMHYIEMLIPGVLIPGRVAEIIFPC
jgi:hypothetical protein